MTAGAGQAPRVARLLERAEERLAAVGEALAVDVERGEAGAFQAADDLPRRLVLQFDLPAGAVPVTCVAAEETRSRGPSRDPVVRAANETDRGSCGLPVGVQVIGLPCADDARPLGSERDVLDVMRLIAAAAA